MGGTLKYKISTMTEYKSKHNYTRNILLQMTVIAILIAAVFAWQWQVIYQIYISNQVNSVGWAVNGGILLLFICGLSQLIKRFFEYRSEETAINRFITNVDGNEEPLAGVRQDSLVAQRFLTLKSLNRRKANINHNALAATLLATESSRNSFLKFVHNVLILTGVFGTIISLSVSLLGASELLQSGGQALDSRQAVQANGLGTMIFGMSTALSTTLTAIITYLFFGYFYIKLTDTQTFLISKIEEVTATTLLPHLQLNQDAVVRDYSESIRAANDLVKRLDDSQQKYADSAMALQTATESLAAQTLNQNSQADDVDRSAELIALMRQIVEQQNATSNLNAKNMSEVVGLLQRGFRLRASDENK